MATKSIYETTDQDRSTAGNSKGALTITAMTLPVLKVIYELTSETENQFILDQDIWDLIEQRMEIRDDDRNLQGKQECWKYRIAWITNELRNARLIDKDNEDYSRWKINDNGIKYIENFDLDKADSISDDLFKESMKEKRIMEEQNKDNVGPYSQYLDGILTKIKSSKVSIFRCATSGRWSLMKDGSFISMSYLDTGKHSTIDAWKKHDSSGKNSIRAWAKSLKKDDYVIVISKNKYYGIAQILDDFAVDEESKYDYDGHQVYGRKVNYLHALEKGEEHGFAGTHNNPATFSKVDQYGFNLDLILQYLETNHPEALESFSNALDGNPPVNNGGGNSNSRHNQGSPKERKMDKNMILYGPPGTGKTYNTVNRALAIIEDKDHRHYEGLEREPLKKEYDRQVKNKQIFFSTFHQSMSYEDFVEGIKPTFNDDKSSEESTLDYEIQAGIFKIACAHAAYNSYKLAHEKASNKKDYSFDELYQSFLDIARSGIVSKDYIICRTLNNKEVEIFDVNRNLSIRARAKGSTADHVAPLTKENIQKLYDRFESIEEIPNLTAVRETVEVGPRTTEFYAVFRKLKEFEAQEFSPEISEEKEDFVELDPDEIIRKFESGVFTEASRLYGKTTDPIILIVDEINRGNVSAIFGELITLLEDDKRKGEDNELNIILPYSKKEFYVPSNLFLIGTMNTADRSVEALDTALRRRFSFEEMMPDPTKVSKEFDGIKLSEVLKVINERIELLVDRDHTIGHAYFMKVKSIDDLAKVFNDKIVPLLQEYFYGDYGKIGLTLGKYFVDRETENSKKEFADFEYENSDDFKTDTYKLNKVSSENILKALKNILNLDKKQEGQTENP